MGSRKAGSPFSFALLSPHPILSQTDRRAPDIPAAALLAHLSKLPLVRVRIELARRKIADSQKLELGLFSHLIGFVPQDDVELAARRVVGQQVSEPVERGHVTLLAADMVKASWKLVREGHAEGRLTAAGRSNQQDSPW